jgi:hypothetical protein
MLRFVSGVADAGKSFLRKGLQCCVATQLDLYLWGEC